MLSYNLRASCVPSPILYLGTDYSAKQTKIPNPQRPQGAHILVGIKNGGKTLATVMW